MSRFHLAYILPYRLALYVNRAYTLVVYLACMLALSLAYIPEFYLAYILVCMLAFSLAYSLAFFYLFYRSIWRVHSGVLS